MLNFISFGSGSSGNCYYLFTNDESLMIDVGIGIRTLKKHFKEYGLHLSLINNILVTHDHADHVKSVGSFSNDHELPVYTTSKVHQGIQNNYCVRHKIASDMVRVIEPGKTFTLGSFQITPFLVPHDSCENVGYKIVYGDITFCIITDAGHVTEEMAQYISEANYLVLESNYDEEMLLHGPYPAHLKARIMGGNGHLSNKLCAEAIAKYASPALRHVWLCHLSDENNHPDLACITVKTILSRDYGLIVGKDFELDYLKRTKPTGVFILQ